ncbi:uncharacterized protein TM35_000312110 [Trypanosoma theileri]|uniref:CHASE domain-containing protein n=1 Tax=Trypanosoma theileri TaxID=67003 RepID=A0A1X0NMS3_9TRYP|nr:uncharacterized protein TM35_000312110 [Trypanosoma theileri]ORC86025.1 hypothetical protein TM35_000312110 [Trypanosoma theileri]
MGNSRGGAVAMKKGLSTTQRRVYWLIGIGLTCAVILIVCIAVPITVFQARDRRERERRWRLEISEADRLASAFRSTVIDAISLTHGMEGFTLGSMTSLPPFNGTVEERIKDQMFPRFNQVASKMHSTTKFVQAFILAPGAVVLQTFPENDEMTKYDFLDPKNELGDPTAIESIDNASVFAFGPLHRALPSFPGEWQLIIRNPIYNVTDVADASRDNFWGFSLVIQDVDAMMDANLLNESTQKNGLDYLIYTVRRKTGESIPIRFSLNPNPTYEEMKDFIDTGTNRAVLRNRLTWYICLRSVHKEPELTRTAIVIIIVSAVFGSLLIFLVGTFMVLICIRDYEGWKHAPKTTPFAIAVIGPCNGEELWELAPECMVHVSERLTAVQRREIVRHRAYEGVQLHPYTTTVVARSVESALQLCFDILEELQSHPIDNNLQELLGDDGRLLLACAVHWCTDARVRMETINRIIRYEGPDVVYSGRMWVFASPNEVCISNAARNVVNNIPGLKIELLGSVFLRGVSERQDLYTISDPSNKRLQAASMAAKAHTSNNNLPMIPSSMETAAGNPLSMDPGLLQPNPFTSREAHGSSIDSSALLYSDGSCRTLESGGIGFAYGSSHRNSNSSSGNMRSNNRLSDGPGGSKGPKQINVPKTLIELVPTDEMSPMKTHRDINTRTDPLSSVDGSNRGSNYEGSSKLRVTTEVKSGINFVEKDQSPFSQMQSGSNTNTGINNKRKSYPNSMNGVMNRSNTEMREGTVPCDGDFVTEALLHPKIPTSVDTHLRAVFEHHAVMLDLSYDSLRTIVYYFFSAFKLLLKPLAAPERSNIFHRFAMAFGVPLHDVLEHLAVRCAMRHIQQLEDTRSLLWNCQQQAQLQMHLHYPRDTSPLVESSGTIQTSETPMASGSRLTDN